MPQNESKEEQESLKRAIGNVDPGAPNTSYLAWRYTTGTASGSVPFTVPSSITPGTYQLRLLYSNGYTALAASNNFTLARTIAGTAEPVNTFETLTGVHLL